MRAPRLIHALTLPAMALAIALLCPALAAQEGDSKVLRRNIDDGEKALKARQFDDARLFLKAALQAEPDNQQALAAYSEVMAGLKRPDDAFAAAVAAFDAPKRNAKTAAAQTSRALALIKASSPALAAFLEARGRAAGEIVKIKPRADKDKRDFDSAWLLQMAAQIAPTDAAVEAALRSAKMTPERRDHALYGEHRVVEGSTSSPVEAAGAAKDGFHDISGKDLWKIAGSGRDKTTFENGEIIMVCRDLAAYADAICDKPEYKILGDFTIKFEVKFKPMAADAPRLIFMVRKIPLGEGGHSFNFRPFSDGDTIPADAAKYKPIFEFMELDFTRKDWRMVQTAATPKDVWKAGTWQAVQITWNQKTQKLVAEVAGKKMFDAVLKNIAVEGMPVFSCIFVEEVRYRNIMLKNQ